MKRYASIDFLRGFAIWLMLLLHEIQRVYDYTWANDAVALGEKPVLFIIIMLIMMFLGGWAGFFLLISAAGNGIAMQKSFQKGRSTWSVLSKQLLVGGLLLVVAFATESITGYHGMLGDLVLGREIGWHNVARAFHMETIHTIAYAIIINGIVHALLSMRGGYKKITRNIIIYLVLAVVTVVVTIPIWNIQTIYGPWTSLQGTAPNFWDGFGFYQQVIADPPGNSFKEIAIKFFLLPIAGRPEPIFPYLATSFIGSIIGILLAREKTPKKEFKVGMWAGLVLVVGGLGGSVAYIATGKQDILQMFDKAWSIPEITAWLPYFLFTLGTNICTTLFVIRIVEFRGRGDVFANKTKYIRRHGFVALSIYNYQFFDFIPRWFLVGIGVDSLVSPVRQPNLTGKSIQVIPWQGLNDNSLWGPWVLFVIVVNFAIWALILYLWEKVDYIGSFEWIINVVAGFGVTAKRYKDYEIGMEKTAEKRPWWKPIRLDANEYFYGPEWINLIEKDEVDHQNMRESRFSLKIGIVSFFLSILILFPFPLIGTVIAWKSRKTEKWNIYNKIGLALSILGLVIALGVIVTFSILSNNDLGLAL